MKVLMLVANATAAVVAIAYVPGTAGGVIVFASSLCFGVLANQCWHEIYP
jgi:hypothetical protein